jgi:outer membrane protein assembly factor BamB
MAAPLKCRYESCYLSTCILIAIAAVRLPAAEPNANQPPSGKPPEVDVTVAVRELNSDKYPRPPSDFRQGHVTPRKLDPAAITKTDKGFTIKLPSGAPIPTLTVYGGKLYASGGFHSREFYCFNAETGELIWAVDLDDDGPTSAVVEDGVIIFNTESCTIFTLDAETGKLLWSWFLGDPLMTTPTISGGRVFTSYPAQGKFAGQKLPLINQPDASSGKGGDPKGNSAEPAPADEMSAPTHVLACFDLKTGKILWQRWIDSDVMSAPVAIDSDLYVTSFGGTIYRFNQKDGTVLSAKRTRATSAPVVVGKEVYFTRRSDTGGGAKAGEALVLADRETAKEQKVAIRKDAPHLDVAVQAKAAFAASGKALDAGNGFGGGAPMTANAPAALANVGQGSVSTLQAYQGSRVLNDGRMNFNCMGDQVLCTDPTSGKVVWSIKLEGDVQKEGGYLAAPPAAAGGQIFLATLKGEILQVEPDKGTINKRYPVGAPLRFQPTIENGRIYVGTQDGQVVCLDTGDRKMTGWSTWGGNAAHTGIREEQKR